MLVPRNLGLSVDRLFLGDGFYCRWSTLRVPLSWTLGAARRGSGNDESGFHSDQPSGRMGEVAGAACVPASMILKPIFMNGL